MANACESRAHSGDARVLYVRFGQGAVRCLLQRRRGGLGPHAKRIRRSRAAAREDVMRFVHQDAFGLRAPAVESQNVPHKERIIDSESVRRGRKTWLPTVHSQASHCRGILENAQETANKLKLCSAIVISCIA